MSGRLLVCLVFLPLGLTRAGPDASTVDVSGLLAPARALEWKVASQPKDWDHTAGEWSGPVAEGGSNLVVHPAGGVWDVSDFSLVRATITNSGDALLWLDARLDSPGANDWSNSQPGSVVVLPGESAVLGFALARSGGSYQGDPVFKGQSGKPNGHRSHWRTLDPARITALRMRVLSSGKNVRFRLSQLATAWPMDSATTAKLEERPFLDALGQVRAVAWPGKLPDTSALSAAIAAESAQPATRPATWNAFGGWKDGPRRSATGFFRIEKVDGKWWFVDPEGCLFWSFGVNSVGVGAATPLGDARKSLFAWLPGESDPLRTAALGNSRKNGPTIDFARANAARVFGPDWQGAARDLTLRRLPHWGINTLGGWSEGSLARAAKTPYTLSTGVWWPVLSNKGHVLPDPYEPGFATSLRKSLREFAWAKDDPWCLGVFIDNELDWPETTGREILAAGPGQGAKKHAVAWLRKKYATIGALNRAWDSDFSDWDALAKSRKTPVTPGMNGDLDLLAAKLAGDYYQLCRRLMREELPNHLYLGSRIHKAMPAAMRAAATHADVLSLNRYELTAAPALPEGFPDVPVLITEYHFGAPDRGVPGVGLRSVFDQSQRGRAMAGFVAAGLVSPRVVGAHWFCWQDQSALGRPGENYQVGFVDVTNRPYPEFIRAARQVANHAYPVRAAPALTPAAALHQLLTRPNP